MIDNVKGEFPAIGNLCRSMLSNWDVFVISYPILYCCMFIVTIVLTNYILQLTFVIFTVNGFQDMYLYMLWSIASLTTKKTKIVIHGSFRSQPMEGHRDTSEASL